ncbi:MAG TPA: Gldg family protein, partial [Chitinophagaceae bacterium]|nr:Gldg family protein [Chitinophagaceae bacterium]
MARRFVNRKQVWWIIAIAALLLINFLAATFHQRVDLTEEKRYSLSKATKDLLYKVDDELVINVFLKGDFPAGFRKLSNTTREFVQVLKESTPANIRYNFISPEDEVENGGGKSWGDSLTA